MTLETKSSLKVNVPQGDDSRFETSSNSKLYYTRLGIPSRCKLIRTRGLDGLSEAAT